MHTSYLTEKAVQFIEQYPTVSLCRQDYNCNEPVVERLTAMGYIVEHLKTYAQPYPKQPEAPEKENYDTTGEYEEASKEYERDFSDYMDKCRTIHDRRATGEITFYIRIEQNEIALCYMAKSVANANGTTEQPLSPVEKLEKQDKRNKEIALEKTVEDTKKQILEVDMSERKFGQDEDKMIYFFLLSYLRKEHYTVVGLDEERHYLSDVDKMNIIATLTPKAKAIIRRDFLIAHFREAYGNNAVATLLLDFAEKHMPDELANIQNGYNEIYEKRHQRIEEKKAVLLVQEQAKQKEAEQPEAEMSEIAA